MKTAARERFAKKYKDILYSTQIKEPEEKANGQEN
jgi:hypothetical protein